MEGFKNREIGLGELGGEHFLQRQGYAEDFPWSVGGERAKLGNFTNRRRTVHRRWADLGNCPRGYEDPSGKGIDSTAYGVGNRVEAGDKDARVVESGFGVRLIKTESGESYCREKTGEKLGEDSPLLPGESTHRKGLECKIACSVTEGGTSGAGAPSWNGLLPGRRIQDGSLTWEIVAGSTTTSWKASTDYKLGDEIIVANGKTNATGEPSWPDVGKTFEDAGVTWEVIGKDAAAEVGAWTRNKAYPVGTILSVTSGTISIKAIKSGLGAKVVSYGRCPFMFTGNDGFFGMSKFDYAMIIAGVQSRSYAEAEVSVRTRDLVPLGLKESQKRFQKVRIR